MYSIIPERDVYRLIMRSKLPAAERFEEWVVGEVLPSIRKHGGYIAGQESMEPAEVLARAVLVANSVIAEKQARIEALEPVAARLDDEERMWHRNTPLPSWRPPRPYAPHKSHGVRQRPWAMLALG